MNCINKFKSTNLIHIQRAGEESQKVTFDIVMKNLDPEDMVRELSEINSITELSLVAKRDY